MANDLLDRAHAPTVPLDTADPPRFGQPTELVKDVLVAELRKFLANAEQTATLQAELPTIEKYSTFALNRDPHASATEVLRKLADRGENLPHIAVMAATGSERKISIGPPFVGRVQEAPRIRAASAEPYALADGDILELAYVRNLAVGTLERDTITFATDRFVDITAATAQEMADEINGQGLLCRAVAVEDGGDTYLEVRLGSSARVRPMGSIEVGYNTSQNVLDVTGFGQWADIIDIGGTRPDMELTFTAGTWTADVVGRYAIVGDTTKAHFNDGRFLITDFATAAVDTLTIESKYGREETGSPGQIFVGLYDDFTNVLRPPKNRYVMSWDLTVGIDVLVDDDNSRGELGDLAATFLAFVMERQYFTFWGRGHFDGGDPADEFFQIVFQPPVRLNAETEAPRMNDAVDMVHVTSYSLNVTVEQYIDRSVLKSGVPFIVSDVVGLEEDETLPVAGVRADADE